MYIYMHTHARACAHVWNNDHDYQRTLIDANHYYETSSCENKKKSTKSKAGKYKVVSLFKTWR